MIKNYDKAFSIFRKNYQNVPLEVFGDNPYKTLISTTLSARTKDEVTLAASNRLFKTAPNIYKLSSMSEKEIAKLIYPVGFYKTKAKHLVKLARILTKNYKGIVPKTLKSLLSLPGVGRKTANLVINRAFNKPAIAVDTHVHRISNLLGWVKTSSPHETERKLNQIMPKEYWSELNKLMVSIGRQYKSEKKLKNFFKENHLI